MMMIMTMIMNGYLRSERAFKRELRWQRRFDAVGPTPRIDGAASGRAGCQERRRQRARQQAGRQRRIAAAAAGFADGEETLNNKRNHGEESTNQHRYNDTTEVHFAQSRFWFLSFGPETTIVSPFTEVVTISQNKTPDEIPGDQAQDRR